MRAFTPRDVFYDSSMAGENSVVEHTTSWLTINPVKGCSLGCRYCFRARWHPSAKPVLQRDVEVVVDELLRHPDFVPDRTPLSINVSSTDALLPTVWPVTREALELLESRRLRNPVGITTKLRLRDDALAFLAGLRNLRPIVFISLALLPRTVEPVPVQPRIDNLRRLAAAGLPCVLYFRPIVAGWNDDEQTIERLLRLADAHCDAVCIGGLRLSPEIERDLATVIHVPDLERSPRFHEKAVPDGAQRVIDDVRRRLELTVPVYKHTSCAVSKILGWPNYNALFEDPAANCVDSCPSKQVARCREQSP